MAFRASTLSSNPGDGSSSNLVGTMPTTSPGDYVGAIVNFTRAPSAFDSVTPPAGWTLVSSGDVAANIICGYFTLTGGAPSSPPASYTWALSSAFTGTQVIIFSLSGRGLTETFVTNSQSAAGFTSPMTISATGGTAAAADDLVFLAGVNNDNGAGAAFAAATGSPGTFALRNTAGGFAPVTLSTLDAAGAGATGTISDVCTYSFGVNTCWTAFVVSVPASVGGPVITAQPQPVSTFAGNTATFSVTATGTGTLHYQWKQNGSNVGTDSSSYTTPTLDMSFNGSVYTVDVTDDNGTTTSQGALLTVYIVAAVAWIRA